MVTCKENKNYFLKTLNDSINKGHILYKSIDMNFATFIPSLKDTFSVNLLKWILPFSYPILQSIITLVRLKMNLADCNEVEVMMIEEYLLSVSGIVFLLKSYTFPELQLKRLSNFL